MILHIVGKASVEVNDLDQIAIHVINESFVNKNGIDMSSDIDAQQNNQINDESAIVLPHSGDPPINSPATEILKNKKIVTSKLNKNDHTQFFLNFGLMIKTIREDEANDKLYIGATVNCKLNVTGNLIDKELRIKELEDNFYDIERENKKQKNILLKEIRKIDQKVEDLKRTDGAAMEQDEIDELQDKIEDMKRKVKKIELKEHFHEENKAEGMKDIIFQSIKEKLDVLNFNMNKTADYIPIFRNGRLSKDESEVSGSFHHNFVLDSCGDTDYCPFIVSKYELSIKLNSPNETNKRGKMKANFESRFLTDLINIQSQKSVGRGVSKTDTVLVASVAKKRDVGGSTGEPKLPLNSSNDAKLVTTSVESEAFPVKESQRNKEINSVIYEKKDPLDKNNPNKFMTFINFDEDNHEVDEVVFYFSTRKNQVVNLVVIIVPCFLVSLIFSEMARKSTLSVGALFSGLLAVVFTMPKKLGFGTSIWYAKTAIIAFILYAVGDPTLGLVVEVIIWLTFPTLLYFFYRKQQKFVSKDVHAVKIKDLVKNYDVEWKEETWRDLWLH